MPSGRSIAAFAVKFLVIYGALTASWPLYGPAYAFFVRESGNALFEAVGARDKVRIRAATLPYGINDTVLSVRAAGEQGMQVSISSWLIGFQPSSLLIGLVLATPVSMRRRVWALFAGLILVHAFVLARLATLVILAPVAPRNVFWSNALGEPVLSPALSCFVPVLIWVAVTVRREDARRLVASTQKKVAA